MARKGKDFLSQIQSAKKQRTEEEEKRRESECQGQTSDRSANVVFAELKRSQSS